jgi:hypothetical protein
MDVPIHQETRLGVSTNGHIDSPSRNRPLIHDLQGPGGKQRIHAARTDHSYVKGISGDASDAYVRPACTLGGTTLFLPID